MKKILKWEEFLAEKKDINDEPKTPKGDKNTPAGCETLKKPSQKPDWKEAIIGKSDKKLKKADKTEKIEKIKKIEKAE